MRVTSRRARAGALLAVLVAAVVAGPYLAPKAQDATVGAPLSTGVDGAPFGTDVVGRDLLSRALHGGDELLLTAALAALGGTALGAALGLVAAVRGGLVGRLLERATEVMVLVPGVLILLLVGAAVRDPAPPVLAAVLALLAVPWVGRVVSAAAGPLLRNGYVEHAIVCGESVAWIVCREVAPNLRSTLLALLGLRFVEALYLVAGAAFLGVGPQPPEADWAVMVRENAPGLLLNPWGTILPASALAAMGIAVMAACGGRRQQDGIA